MCIEVLIGGKQRTMTKNGYLTFGMSPWDLLEVTRRPVKRLSHPSSDCASSHYHLKVTSTLSRDESTVTSIHWLPPIIYLMEFDVDLQRKTDLNSITSLIIVLVIAISKLFGVTPKQTRSTTSPSSTAHISTKTLRKTYWRNGSYDFNAAVHKQILATLTCYCYIENAQQYRYNP